MYRVNREERCWIRNGATIRSTQGESPTGAISDLPEFTQRCTNWEAWSQWVTANLVPSEDGSIPNPVSDGIGFNQTETDLDAPRGFLFSTTWQDFVRKIDQLRTIHPTLHGGTNHPVDTTNYLRFVYPQAKFNELSVLRTALERVRFGQVLRIPWKPLYDPIRVNAALAERARRGQTAELDGNVGESITMALPHQWGCAEGNNYFLDMNFSIPIDIRHNGLKATKLDSCPFAGVTTFKSREFPLKTNNVVEIAFPDEWHEGTITKKFKVLMGFGTSPNCVPFRTNHPVIPDCAVFVHRVQNLQPMFLEFHPVQECDHCIDRTYSAHLTYKYRESYSQHAYNQKWKRELGHHRHEKDRAVELLYKAIPSWSNGIYQQLGVEIGPAPRRTVFPAQSQLNRQWRDRGNEERSWGRRNFR